MQQVLLYIRNLKTGELVKQRRMVAAGGWGDAGTRKMPVRGCGAWVCYRSDVQHSN